MAKRSHLAASIGGRRIHPRDGATAIPTRGGERTTCRRVSSLLLNSVTLLKAALILGIITVLALLVYRALRPYLKLIRQFIQTVRYFQQANPQPPSARREGEKLIKCAACDTWIPESRALHANGSEYCSRVCLQRAAGRSRKAG